MKVLIVSFYYTPEIGAAPSRITNMAEGLKHLGAEVDVLTCLPNYPKGKIFEGYRKCFSKKETINGINIYRYWTYASVSKNPFSRVLGMTAFATTMWAFALHIKRVRSYDRVIIQSPPIMVATSALILFKKLFRRTTILNVSDLWPLSAVELGAVRENSKMHKLLLWMEKFNYKTASAFQCQSNEIIEHIKGFQPDKEFFLYRNLQHQTSSKSIATKSSKSFKIVYAGLLGVAQNIAEIIRNIDFKKLNAEFHIFGGGNQAKEIEEYIQNNDCSVFYHGYLEKSDMVNELSKYDASIVPLTVRIKGAVPSKIFDLLPVGIPILFCGGGEGAEIIKQYNLGLVSDPADMKALESNIQKMVSMSEDEYMKLKDSCLSAANEDFSFDMQMSKYIGFLKGLELPK